MTRYATYFKDIEGINIHQTLGDAFPSSDFAFMRLQCHIGQLSLLKTDDDFDFSRIPAESIEFFNIKIHDINTLREYLREVSDYGIMENTLSEEGFTVYGPWRFNELTDHVYPDKKPYDNWVWDDQRRHWAPPIERPLLGELFTSKWNQPRGDWDVEIVNIAERKYRAFQLWKMVPQLNGDFYSDACSSSDYMIRSFETLTHGSADFDVIVSSGHGIPRLESDPEPDNPRTKYKVVRRHDLALDFAPICAVSYSELDKEFIDTYSLYPLWSVHPQCVAPTIHELFRLAIEWAWSYRHLGNAEPVAVHCDYLLRIVQMPLEVREDLIQSVPDQPVARYIKGDPLALSMYEEDPEMPESFKYWIMKMYSTYGKKESGNRFSAADVLDDYPM